MSTHRESAQYWYSELIEGLRLISSEFTVQEKSLPTFVHLPDEVLNAVHLDTLGLVVEYGLITNEQFEKIKELDAVLESIDLPSGYEGMLEQMKCGSDFKNLRKIALNVLHSLGEPYQEPNISAVYVKGS